MSSVCGKLYGRQSMFQLQNLAYSSRLPSSKLIAMSLSPATWILQILVSYHYHHVNDRPNLSFLSVKFFNGMAEKHDAQAILATARNLVQQVQTLVQDGSDRSHHSLFDR